MRQRIWLLIITPLCAILARLVLVSPRLAFALADRVARIGVSFHLPGGGFRGIAREYAASTRGDEKKIGRSLTAADLKTRVLVTFGRQTDEEHVATVVRWEDEASIRQIMQSRRGAVFATWHMGPTITALFSALSAQNIDAGMVNYTSASLRKVSVELLGTADAPGQAALSFARALAILRAGRIVVIAVDGKWGSDTAPVLCLGREVGFRRGFAALARMTGAPVYPVGTRWEGGDRPVVITLGEPIASSGEGSADQVELSLSEGLARWIEHHLTTTPDYLSRGFSKLA